jgi:DNA polymerase III gamma/tau subunit
MTTAIKLLLDTARRGELHHAVILHGPDRDLLRSTAVQIAQSLNCLNGTAGDDCAACQRIERHIHPDVHFIEVTGDRKLISVEQIREILAGASMRPFEGRNKIFIIDPADGLSASGSNSLLKTLEEPTRDTTFLLLTRSPDLLLPTIRSRSQSIYLGGEAPRDANLAKTIEEILEHYAQTNDRTALLTLAAIVADTDAPADAMALLGSTLARAVAGVDDRMQRVRDAVGIEKLLAAADALTNSMRWLTVNADVRLLIESALANIVVAR